MYVMRHYVSILKDFHVLYQVSSVHLIDRSNGVMRVDNRTCDDTYEAHVIFALIYGQEFVN